MVIGKKVILVVSILMNGLNLSALELIVESTAVGSLDSVIFADTLPNGSRVDSNRVYVLRRSTIYQLSQTIQWSGFPLGIRAEEGPGAKPMILFTGISHFRLENDAHLFLEGLHVNGSSQAVRLIRIDADYCRVVINDCVLEEASQSAFRLQGDSISVIVKNSIFNRLGNPVDPDNGRLFDNRGYIVDTLLMYNSIGYMATSRFYRNGSGTLRHGIFEQNTFWASGQHGFDFGMIDHLVFKNNIVANPAFLGETITMLTHALSMSSFTPGINEVEISHNNFFIDPGFDSILPAMRFDGEAVFSINGDFFNKPINDAIVHSGTAPTIFFEILNFTDPPNVPSTFIAASADMDYSSAGSWDFSDLTPFPAYSEPGIDRYTTFHDFSYPDTAMSYTAGAEGQPLGAHLNFCNYPMKLELSLDTLQTGTYFALDTLILQGTNLIADSLHFISKNIIELNPNLESQVGRSLTLTTDSLLCDEFIKWE